MKLAPSILTADWSRLGEQIREAETAGVDQFHLDVMDGHFVPNISFGPLVVAAIREMTTLPLEVHLMISHPEEYVDAFVEAGAKTVIVQQEATIHLHRQIQQIKELNCRAGVALNPATPLITLEDVLSDLDQVLVMSVNPGFGGQQFIAGMSDKIRRMRAMIDERGLSMELEVDGGVKPENIAAVAAAGATITVVGSAVYNPQHSVEEAVRRLRAALDG